MMRTKSGSAKRLLAMLVMSCMFLNPVVCTDNENFNEFRSSTGPGLESGVQALFDGDVTGLDTIVDTVISGLFVIYAPDADSSN